MFEKLFKKPVIKNSGMQKVDMSLAFQASNAGGATASRYVDLLAFCHMMLRFYELKMVKQHGYT
jgi:hypothetical protein